MQRLPQIWFGLVLRAIGLVALGDIYELKSKPKRLLIVLLGTLLGGIVGIVVQFGRAK
jgi:uncharacterized membrane protein YqgA involved in biofilm formation